MDSNTWLEYFGIFISIFIFVWMICFCMKNCRKRPQTTNGQTIAYGNYSTFDKNNKDTTIAEYAYSDYLDGI